MTLLGTQGYNENKDELFWHWAHKKWHNDCSGYKDVLVHLLIDCNIIINSGLALCLPWFLIARNFDFLLPKNAGFVLFPLSH